VSVELDNVLDDYRARLDRALAGHDAPSPDVAAVVARAVELNDELDPRFAELGAWSEVEPQGEVGAAAEVGSELAAFVGAYRERLDDSVDSRRAPTAARAGSGVRTWGMALGIAAALVLVAVGLQQSRWVAREVGRSSAAQAVAEAQQEVRGGVIEAAATKEASSPRARARPRSIDTPAVEPKPWQLETQPESPQGEIDVDGPEAQPEAPKVQPEPANPPRASVDARIAQLDAQARAAWKRGDLAQAERRFRKITKIGGRRRATELAFAELFALVRQRGGDARSQWREYLKRFPHGRYAADARVGLCRGTTGQARVDCVDKHRP